MEIRNDEASMLEIMVKSTMDGTEQPALFYEAEHTKKRPLLVGLHTWGGDRFNQVNNMLPYAKKLKWNLVLPEFRGANIPSNPICREACGSMAAKQDIVDVVKFIEQNYNIDSSNIFLLGASGGGHMALLMAAYAPSLWKAIASFVPITNLVNWHEEMKVYPVTDKYVADMEACCGGKPEGIHIKEYMDRSPVSYIDDIAKANVMIFHGKFDMQVLVSHSIDLYRSIYDRHPLSRVFLNIFDGEHEQRMEDAVRWFRSQMKPGLEKTQATG